MHKKHYTTVYQNRKHEITLCIFTPIPFDCISTTNTNGIGKVTYENIEPIE